MTYTRKEAWPTSSELRCLHCGGPIDYRPIPIGISINAFGIQVCNGFCSWPCARSYASANFPSDATERLTTQIMVDFKSSKADGDDPAGYDFLQNFDRFSQIPQAPPRHLFEPNGHLSYSQFRQSWVEKISVLRADEHILRSTASDVAGFGYDEPRPATFRRANMYSSKPSPTLHHSVWPAFGTWS